MIFVRTTLLVLGLLMALTAVGQPKLVGFVEKNGCRLLAWTQEIGRMFVPCTEAEARRGFKPDPTRAAALRHAAGGTVVCAILQTG